VFDGLVGAVIGGFEAAGGTIGDLYRFPFQNNTNFGFGPHGGTQDILNIQPVIPIHLTPDWNVITRTVFPLVWTPDLSPAPSVPSARRRRRFRRSCRRTVRPTAGSGASGPSCSAG
jgi:hypothetical protein